MFLRKIRAEYTRGDGDEITFATPATEYAALPEEMKVGEVRTT